MGRGRTTTGMSVACMIATIVKGDMVQESMQEDADEGVDEGVDMQDSAQYLNGGFYVRPN